LVDACLASGEGYLLSEISHFLISHFPTISNLPPDSRLCKHLPNRLYTTRFAEGFCRVQQIEKEELALLLFLGTKGQGGWKSEHSIIV
jgi:hypothetical protein